MRMMGHVIGALTTTAKRRSVILSADGSDARFTLACTRFAAASAAASPVNAIAPAAPRPTVLKNERRSTPRGDASNSVRTARFIASSQFLEVELQRELHRPVVHNRRRDAARGRRIEVLVREAEARIVEQIERIPPKLDVRPARRRESLRQRRIEIHMARTVEDAAAAVAVSVCRRGNEVARVVPEID